jgi:hypothetical protein
MTIVDQGPEIEPASRPRPWWFAPALVGIALGSVVGAAVIPWPLDTTSAQELEVIDRLKGIGVPSVATGDPHFSDVLGSAFLSRDYVLGEYGEYGGVSVTFPAFVGGPHDIRVCAEPNGQGRLVYVDRQMVRSVNSEPSVYLVSSRYFVIAPDERAVSVLQRGLGVTRALC